MRYDFMRTRRWSIASVVVLAAVVTMVSLALWQLRRHEEVRTANERVRAQLALPAAPIEEVDPASARFRRVEVTGAYDVDAEVVLDNRSLEGRSGKHLLTPLVVEGGPAVIVDRGWIPLTLPANARGSVEPPAGEVSVTGVLFPSERKGMFGPSIPPEGRLSAVPRVDVPRIAKQLPYAVYPLYMRLESQEPAQAELPIPPGPPVFDAGPHLSYAVQWFLFAIVALAVFGALARRESRRTAPFG